MRKWIVFLMAFILCFICLSIPVQANVLKTMTFTVNSVSAKGHKVFVAGNFNDWIPNQIELRNGNGSSNTYQATISVPENLNVLEYKFVLDGSWERVEEFPNGDFIPNHEYKIYTIQQFATHTIENWAKTKKDANGETVATFQVHIDEIRTGTSPTDRLYITSSENNWNPADPAWELKRYTIGDARDNAIWTATETIPKNARIQYKITRGSWETVETKDFQPEIYNRIWDTSLPYEMKDIYVSVWSDAPKTSMILKVHEPTNGKEDVYFSGNYNGWSNYGMPMQKVSNGSGGYDYQAVLYIPKGASLYYKYLRGTQWSMVERSKTGSDIPDRLIKYNQIKDTFDTIQRW